MRSAKWLIAILVLVTAGLGLLLLRERSDTPAMPQPAGTQPAAERGQGQSLLLYCAAGIRKPVEEAARRYQERYHVRVDLQFGGSGTLLSNLKLSGQGDLYLAGDDSYIRKAQQEKLVLESLPLATMQPVIALAKGNPKNIRSAADLSRADLRIALADPEAAAVGKETKQLLTSLKLWEQVEQAARDRGVFKTTVNEIANDLKLGTVDAGIIWDATVRQSEYREQLEMVALTTGDQNVNHIAIGVLASSANPTAALAFARYLGARDQGLKLFAQDGFAVAQGDVWAARPKLLLFCGGVNRVAVEKTLEQFAQREGVDITTVFNGCGILIGQIKMGEKPDAYQTCDASFMKGVEAQFEDCHQISQTDIVMLVQKGNPRKIRSLADLGQEGLKLGLGNPQQSTLGALTQQLLIEEKIQDQVNKNVAVSTPTADLLVAQIRTGALDAAVVYRANTNYVHEHLDVIDIANPRAQAVQTFAAAKESEHKLLVQRLEQALRGSASQERFEKAGFRWLGAAQAQP